MLTDDDKIIIAKENYMYLDFYRPSDPKVENGKLVCDISHKVVAASYLDCFIAIDEFNFHRGYFDTSYLDDNNLCRSVSYTRDDNEGTLIRKYLNDLFHDKNRIYDVYEACTLPPCVTLRLADNLEDRDNYLHLRVNLHDGSIVNWPKGIKAMFRYKSSDRNYFILRNKKEMSLFSSKEHPEARGIASTQYMIGPGNWFQVFGDYLWMDVDMNGHIINWNEQEMKQSLEYWVNGIKIGDQYMVAALQV